MRRGSAPDHYALSKVIFRYHTCGSYRFDQVAAETSTRNKSTEVRIPSTSDMRELEPYCYSKQLRISNSISSATY